MKCCNYKTGNSYWHCVCPTSSRSGCMLEGKRGYFQWVLIGLQIHIFLEKRLNSRVQAVTGGLIKLPPNNIFSSWGLLVHTGPWDGLSIPGGLYPVPSSSCSAAGRWARSTCDWWSFYCLCWRKTDSKMLHSKQANEAWASPKKGIWWEM